jgi:hypothetical protein
VRGGEGRCVDGELQDGLSGREVPRRDGLPGCRWIGESLVVDTSGCRMSWAEWEDYVVALEEDRADMIRRGSAWAKVVMGVKSGIVCATLGLFLFTVALL